MDNHGYLATPAWRKEIDTMQTVATGIDDDGIVKAVVGPQAVSPWTQRRIASLYPLPDISLVTSLVERRAQGIVEHVPARTSQHDRQQDKDAKNYPKYEMSVSTILHKSNFKMKDVA